MDSDALIHLEQQAFSRESSEGTEPLTGVQGFRSVPVQRLVVLWCSLPSATSFILKVINIENML